MVNVYEFAEDVKALVEDVVRTLSSYFNHIDTSRIICVRTRKSRSRAIARIHGLPSIWRFALNLKPHYIIEVIAENYDPLPHGEKIKTVIHELLHIPPKFSGGLRPHGRYVNSRVVEKLYLEYIKQKRSST